MGEVATDYDRACDVQGGAALLTAGSGWVIALSTEVAGVELDSADSVWVEVK